MRAYYRSPPLQICNYGIIHSKTTMEGFMDTEIVVSIAQILTGAATLIVAVFLAGQLVL